MVASRKYKSLVFRYTSDLGTISIKHQKLAINPDTGDTFAPIVPLLSAREYSTTSKLESLGTVLRHLDFDVETRRASIVIPYAPDQSSSLKAYIQQVIGSPSVKNASYVGESNYR